MKNLYLSQWCHAIAFENHCVPRASMDLTPLSPSLPTLLLFLTSIQRHWKIRMMTRDEYRRQLQQKSNRVCTSDYIVLHSENRKMWLLRRNAGYIITVSYKRKTMNNQLLKVASAIFLPSLQSLLIFHTESRL